MPKQFTLQTSIVGVTFRGKAAGVLLAGAKPGDFALLQREPDNKFDPNAIRVIYENEHVGYVKALDSLTFAPEMDKAGVNQLLATFTSGEGIFKQITTTLTLPDEEVIEPSEEN